MVELVDMRTRPLATTVDDGSIVFGAKDGQADIAPEPFTLLTLWAYISGKVATLLASKEAVGVAAAGDAAHVAAADPHTQYHTNARGDARYSSIGHAHAVTSLQPHVLSPSTFGDIPLFDPTQGDATAGKFQFVSSSHPWTNGPVGNTNYTDHVASWGWNIKAPTIQDVSGVPGFCMSIENRFYNGDAAGRSSMQTEWQLRGIRADGTQFRPLEIDCPHDGIGNRAHFRIRELAVGKETSGADLATTNTFIVHPLGAETSGDAILTIAPTIDAIGAGRAFQVQYPTQTARSQAAIMVSGDTTWDVTCQINNVRAAGSSNLAIITNGTGWAYISLPNSGNGRLLSLGKDSSDDFAVSFDSLPSSTNRAFRVARSTRQTSFDVAPKLPSFTVAGVPSAATYGAGSMIYVSNEIGGACVAFSDGTSWRRVTDRAVVS